MLLAGLIASIVMLKLLDSDILQKIENVILLSLLALITVSSARLLSYLSIQLDLLPSVVLVYLVPHSLAVLLSVILLEAVQHYLLVFGEVLLLLSVLINHLMYRSRHFNNSYCNNMQETFIEDQISIVLDY